MLSGSKQDAQEITTELSRIMRSSADGGAQDLTRYVSVLQANMLNDFVCLLHVHVCHPGVCPGTCLPVQLFTKRSHKSNLLGLTLLSVACIYRALLVQGLLSHTVIPEVEELDGRYKQAFDRIINQVASHHWRVGHELLTANASSMLCMVLGAPMLVKHVCKITLDICHYKAHWHSSITSIQGCFIGVSLLAFLSSDRIICWITMQAFCFDTSEAAQPVAVDLPPNPYIALSATAEEQEFAVNQDGLMSL